MATKTRKTSTRTPARLPDLQARLEELEQTIQAIRSGEVDAVVVTAPEGDRVFTLQGADHAYRVLVEAINEGAATLDAHGLILYANGPLAAMVKVPLKKLVGSRIHSFIETCDIPELEDLLRAAQMSPQKKECILALADGGRLPVYLSLSPLKGAGFHGLCMIATDLTEQKIRQEELAKANYILEAEIAVRKRAEHAVRQAEEVFHAFMNYSPSAVFIQDEEGRYIFCNKHAEELVGIEQRGLLGKTAADWLPGEAGKQLRDRDQAALRSIGPTERIEVIPSKNNGPIELLMVRFPFHDPSGRRLLGGVGIDVTPQRRAEASLRQLTGRLITLRDEEQRRIARELHDSTAQTLAALVLNLNMLQSHKELHANAVMRKLMMTSFELADAASNEIRNLSHLLHPPVLDVMGLIAAIEWHTARTVELTGIKVKLDLPPSLGRLPNDIEIALFRVLQESLENVRRHSGSSVAKVRLQRTPSHVTLEIEDEGRGASPGVLSKGDYPSGVMGVGVAGMHERLRHLGGVLEIDSGKKGTKVKAAIPLRAKQQSSAPR